MWIHFTKLCTWDKTESSVASLIEITETVIWETWIFVTFCSTILARLCKYLFWNELTRISFKPRLKTHLAWLYFEKLGWKTFSVKQWSQIRWIAWLPLFRPHQALRLFIPGNPTCKFSVWENKCIEKEEIKFNTEKVLLDLLKKTTSWYH